MDESGLRDESVQEASATTTAGLVRPVSDGPAEPVAFVQPAQQPCPTCGTGGASMPASYVYAIGRIEPRFPRLSVEKEFAQATGRAETVNLTDRQALQRVLQ